VLFLITRYLPYVDGTVTFVCESLLGFCSFVRPNIVSRTVTYTPKVDQTQCAIEIHMVDRLYTFGFIMAESERQVEIPLVLSRLNNTLR
jgi:hypothetical protein